MNKFSKNARGFGVIEIIILMVVVGLLAGAGWFFMQRSDNNETNNTSSKNTVGSGGEAADTKDWKAYSTSFGISFKYPSDWITEIRTESDGEHIIVGPPASRSDSTSNPDGAKIIDTVVFRSKPNQDNLSADDVAQQLKDSATKQPDTLADIEVVKINSLDMVRFHVVKTNEDVALVFPSGGRSVAVTANNVASDKAAFSANFQAILDSITSN